MDKDLKIIVGIVIVLVILLLAMLLGSESCEDKGKQSVFSHYQPVSSGKTVYLTPIYKCEEWGGKNG